MVIMNWLWLVVCAVLVGFSIFIAFMPGVAVIGRLALLVPILGGLFRGYFDGLGPILDRRGLRRSASEGDRA
ncbi:hypothetical protein ACFQO7_18815 [Catellatospora aurea]|uniref:Uncharacterized protein n=1 Tax=Catellatospora aurea TaxID=1337874 RepID=A0ABW2H1Q4_9ACTN